ncbi:RNA polymerase sigma factor [Agathobaculum sp.]|uniref:RNA polymerase sigma factor n=1 Tax=Agathobaculum sp. TaxID=2048138 RepID=UPI001C3A3A16|nr:RNA polymerase sigma factor [Agathobaculum sp.]HIX10652.1 RNA polymerase sigma factor [Candidatus Agathobaculum pullistercoris]
MKQFDKAEAERLVYTYSDLILRLSYTYLKSTHDAEDICQTVFLKLLTSGQTFASPAHEKAWIIRTTANACKDALRSTFRRRTVALEAAAATAAPEAPDNAVLEAVMELPENYREAVYLHYFEGYSVREIAGLLGRSEAAVTAHLSRGRHKLRTTLGGEYYEQSV